MLKESVDYKIDPDLHGLGKQFTLKTNWRKDFLKVIKDKRVASILLSEHAGWQESSVAFLAELPRLKEVYIYSRFVTDLEPLSGLSRLQYLSLLCPAKTNMDFTVFPELKELFLEWRKEYDAIHGNNQLRKINILKYPHPDLTKWRRSARLRALGISDAKLKTLEGLESFPNLQELSLVQCRTVKSLDPVRFTPRIKSLEFYKCYQLEDLSGVTSLAHLKEVEIEDCSEIDSLAPLLSCPNLVSLRVIGNTSIRDGDMRGFLNLPKLKKFVLRRQRHYSHTSEQIMESISQRS